MKAVRTASIGLAALFIVSPCAEAQQASTPVSFVQKLQPVLRSHPGILGIRVGMTAAQAEAIAEKSYPGKAQEYRAPDFFSYKEVTVRSHSFVQRVDFTNQTGHTSDKLSLYFTSPVTGNTLYAMSRTVSFENISPLNRPLISTLKASLIKKYGPTSYFKGPDPDKLTIAWVFKQKSRLSCKFFDCVGAEGAGGLDNHLDQTASLQTACGDSDDYPNLFRILAEINESRRDETKVLDMAVSIWDAPTCMNDAKEAEKQLKAAAIKFYDAVSKAPAAPKL